MVENSSHGIVLQHENRLVRETLAGRLRNEPGITLTGTVPTGPDLIQLCRLRRPAVVVFEADAPRWSNERLVSLLAQPGRQMRMIGLHHGLPAAYVTRAYEAGVSAMVSYASGLETLLDAVRSPALPVEIARNGSANGNALTERELEVLYLLSAGYPARQVAVELGISLHTVDNHKQRIFGKLDVQNQAHAVAIATRLGLSSAEEPPQNPHPGKTKRRHQVSVVLSALGSQFTERVRQALAEQGIPLLDESGEAQSNGDAHPEVVTVLVDPQSTDWPAMNTHQGGRLVVITGRDHTRAQLTKALASGIVTLPVSRIDDLLSAAIVAAGHGHVLVESSWMRSLVGPPRANSKGGWQRWELALTQREREILNSIGRGHAAKQTARLLGISIRTVENLQGNLFRKLRVHSRAAALVAARELGLLDE